MKRLLLIGCGCFAVTLHLYGNGGALPASQAGLNPQRLEVVAHAEFPDGKGVILKNGLMDQTTPGSEIKTPDLSFDFDCAEAGVYMVNLRGALTERGFDRAMNSGAKYGNFFGKIQLDDEKPAIRMFFVPWGNPKCDIMFIGQYQLARGPHRFKLWIPTDYLINQLDVAAFHPPAVPAEAENYVPPFTPPPTHPRIWITPALREKIKANTRHPESKLYYDIVRKQAETRIKFDPPPGGEASGDEKVEDSAVAKAFFYQIDGDPQMGADAVTLMLSYIAKVQFPNGGDITRAVGRAIYSAALVYDWCYDLLTPEEKEIFRRNMYRLACEMECEWPPFGQHIVNGHGNEAQINRDLLSMAIAIYDEDPVPYKYCSYLTFERLIPMRKFEYQSPRHSQGLGYMGARLNWEMMNATIWQRMLGRKVFDDNIADLRRYFSYFRMPSGEMFRDGDGVLAGYVPNGYAYGHTVDTTLLNYVYAGDPVLKADFFRQNKGRNKEALLFLLLNDPALVPDNRTDTMPLTFDTGDVIGGMVCRSSWEPGPESPAVMAEIKGGGYHFGNHQHADAGAFQIYFRGYQIGDLGYYRYYGTDYDFNFAKRSIAHSMMLFFDPEERFYRNAANDGGIRLNQVYPQNPENLQQYRQFNHGKVISCSFGPDPFRSEYNYFAVNLQGAYSDKVTDYVRRFVFLTTGDKDIPALIFICDNASVSNPGFRKYWQVNLVKQPEISGDTVISRNVQEGRKGSIYINMLLPKPEERTMEIKTGNWVFGKTHPNPRDEKLNGFQVMFSPKNAAVNDRFLACLQMVDGEAEPKPVETGANADVIWSRCGNYTVVFPAGSRQLDRSFRFEQTREGKVLFTGLDVGKWQLNGMTFEVEKRKNTLFATLPAGVYEVTSKGDK